MSFLERTANEQLTHTETSTETQDLKQNKNDKAKKIKKL